MYGTNVSDQISVDLAHTPGLSSTINHVALLMVALNPLTKIPLALRPLSDIIMNWFNLHPTVIIPTTTSTTNPPPSVESATSTSPYISLNMERQHDRHERLKMVFRACVRMTLALLVILGGLIMHSFQAVLTLLGSGALIIIVILPLYVNGRMFGWKWWTRFICGLGIFFTIYGAVASLWLQSQDEEKEE
ncbi:hypothetical protein M231_05884 [Tremella mesenterica]|uniref:Amino acid transporter transmembrane domain-containing protein n=1 Tax=Tremella mesenterica TaxID=5217 RepID=A0A4Q1BGZ0_TREME|nr:hypothetical protein M231_05884 [Tremella mesenterica]